MHFFATFLFTSFVWAQAGINTTNPQQVFHVDGEKDNSITGVPTSSQQLNDVVVTNIGNLGIGTTVPRVDATGNVVVQNSTPIQTIFKSFNIDANTPNNSVVTIGTLQFRYPAITCTNTPSYIQVRSTTTDNSGIFHSMYRTAQNVTTFVNTVPTATPITSSFGNVMALPLDCLNDGHAQFNFFHIRTKHSIG